MTVAPDGPITSRPGFWAIAEDDPGRIAVIDADGAAITYGELLTTSRAIAAGLARLGLRRGDGVAVVLPNVPSFFACYLAAMESGLYFTPVNSHLAPPELAYILADCEAGAAVVHADLAELCRPGLEASAIPVDARFADGGAAGLHDLADLVAAGEGEPTPPRSPGTVMMYTSGTTGRPKGVRRPLPEGDPSTVLGNAAVVYCTGFGVKPGGGRHLVCGPLYHAGPSSAATSALHAGVTIVLMGRWTPEGCLDMIQRHRITSSQMVPTMFHRLLALPDDVKQRYDVSSVESVMHTGAPCPAHVKQRFMDWFGPVVFETYGGTESVATIATPRRWLEKPGTVGRAIHGVTVHILDDDGNELPPGEVGTIYIENRNTPPAEYFKDEGKTASMRRGTWVTLGDMGFLDDDGFLFLRDRAVDMVISGGVNIYPAEIESALLESPLVRDVAVIGVPDEEWGESVMAIVEPADGVEPSPATAERLLAHCEGRLARFKHPRRIEFVTELPRLPSGKVQKRILREPYWRGVDRSI